MGDMGELFNDLKEESKQRKKRNLRNAIKALNSKSIPYEEKNHGVHFVIKKNKGLDYYPTTGKWIDRATGRKSRGIKSLLRFLKEFDGSEGK